MVAMAVDTLSGTLVGDTDRLTSCCPAAGGEPGEFLRNGDGRGLLKFGVWEGVEAIVKEG
jgi:hypothetical protein